MLGRVKLPRGLRQIAHDWFDGFKNIQFNQALYTGTLPKSTFDNYLEQDAIYLKAYAAAMHCVTQKAPDANTKKTLEEIAEAVVSEELAQVKAYQGSRLRIFGEAKVVKEVLSYNRHLAESVHAGYAEGMAALVVCPWAYEQLGHCMDGNNLVADHPYRKVIQTYSKPQYREATQKMMRLFNGCFKDVEEDYTAQAKLKDKFCRSLHHEQAFLLRMGEQHTNNELVEGCRL